METKEPLIDWVQVAPHFGVMRIADMFCDMTMNGGGRGKVDVYVYERDRERVATQLESVVAKLREVKA